MYITSSNLKNRSLEFEPSAEVDDLEGMQDIFFSCLIAITTVQYNHRLASSQAIPSEYTARRGGHKGGCLDG